MCTKSLHKRLCNYNTIVLFIDTIEQRKEWPSSVINLTLLGSALSLLINSLIDIPLVTALKDPFCEIQSRIKDVTFGSALFFTYFVLWFRVFTAFYRNEFLKNDLNKAAQVINLTAMPLLTIMGTTLVILFLTHPASKATAEGCACKSVIDRKTYVQHWIAVFVCTTLFQCVLLFSLMYTLYFHRKKMLRSGFDQAYIIPIIKRAVVAAGACITSDLLNFVFTAVYNGSTLYADHLAYSINLFANLMASLFSFTNWRDLLFPFRKNLNRDNSNVKRT